MKRLIVGISGASCADLSILLLQQMKDQPDWETHVVVTKDAHRTLECETRYTLEDIASLAARLYPPDDVGASLASGTFKTEGMVIVPCSMKTLAGIAVGYADNLLLRAADVVIKERRKLVLVVRETPLSLIHLKNMVTLASVGAVILPPMLTGYTLPATLEDAKLHIVGKIMAEFGIEMKGFRRWSGAD